MSAWTHSICERCWVDKSEAERQVISWPSRVVMEATEPDGELKPRSVANVCCYCGYPTWAGIFLREDPSRTMFCDHETELFNNGGTVWAPEQTSTEVAPTQPT